MFLVVALLGLVASVAGVLWRPGASPSALSVGDSGGSVAAAIDSGRDTASSLYAASLSPTAFHASVSADPYGIVLTTTVGAAPAAVAYDSGKGQIFVVNSNSNNVSVISDVTGRVLATVVVGSGPDAVAYDAGRGEVFVANSNSNNVSVISDVTDHVAATVSVGTGPVGAVYDSGKGEVFVANFVDNTVSVIADASNTVVATVPVGSAPWGMAYDSAKGEVFVTNVNSNTVSVIADASNTVVATVSVGQAPSGAAYDPGRGEVFVTNFNSSTVSVLSDATNMVSATVTVGSGPLGVAGPSAAGEVVVVNSKSSNASVISDASNTVIASVNLFYGGTPVGVAYDSGNGGWYIADTAADTVLVIAHGYNVTFTETGLPSATMWILWVNGTSRFGTSHTELSSVVPTLRLVEPNGTYSFAVAKVTGYDVTPSPGSITVAGADVTQSVTFSKLYSVTFEENGLPAGTTWSVTVAGVTKSSTTASLSFAETNGTHPFSVGSLGNYSSNPASGNVTVSGADVVLTLAFGPSSTGTNAPGLLGLPGSTGLFVLVGIAAVVIVVGLLMVLRMRRRRTPPAQGAEPPSPGEPPA